MKIRLSRSATCGLALIRKRWKDRIIPATYVFCNQLLALLIVHRIMSSARQSMQMPPYFPVGSLAYTPVMAAGTTDRIWTVEEIVRLVA